MERTKLGGEQEQHVHQELASLPVAPDQQILQEQSAGLREIRQLKAQQI